MAAGRGASAIGAWALRVLIGVVVLAALLSIGFVLFGVSGETLGRVISTNVALVVFALLVWVDSVIGRYRPDWFELSSLALDAYLLLLWIGVIWFGSYTAGDIVEAFFLGLGTLLWVRAMIGLGDLLRLLWSRWRSQATDVIAIIGLAAIALIAVLVTLPAPQPFNDFWDLDYYGRVIGAISIVAGVCFVLVPLWGLVTTRGQRAAAPAPGAVPSYPPVYAGGNAPYAAAPAPAAPYAAPAPAAQPAEAPAPQPAAAPAAAQPAPAPIVAPVPTFAPPPAAAQQLAWPRLLDGRPVPAGPDGRPDFAALAPTDRLAWPTFVDGTPVPAAPDGSPLYR
ncbi:hypothetical protein ACRAWB_03430 [Leifsonia poae]|uniref:hypothetical protein n=1 Tax=Leifsonia poae TaxID=110933 RepID=UPI003D68A1BD